MCRRVIISRGFYLFFFYNISSDNLKQLFITVKLFRIQIVQHILLVENNNVNLPIYFHNKRI